MLNQTKIVVDGQIEDIFTEHIVNDFPYRSITFDRRHFPKIICICGSTKFKDEFEYANAVLTLQGCIVLSVGFFGHSGDKTKFKIDNFDSIKPALDELHKRKIDLADEIFVINANDYIGESTKSEIKYALSKQKPVKYWYCSKIEYDFNI